MNAPLPSNGPRTFADGKMLVAREGAVGFITFNNPEKRNAFTDGILQGLIEILGEFREDDSVRVVVFTGAGGKAFVSGADLSRPTTAVPGDPRPGGIAAVSAELTGFPKPTIASIRGYCLGGGLTLALSIDLRIAAVGSQFGIPAARLGVAYGFDGLRRLVSLVGPAHARMIMYTGRRLGADEALRIGLVNQVVPDEDLDDVVRGLALEIASNAPLSVKAACLGIEQVLRDPDDRDLQALTQLRAKALASEDLREGREAFMKKRPPSFHGR